MLKKYASLFACAALFALAFAPVSARAESQRPDVEELLEVLRMEQNLQEALGQVEQLLPQITANVAAQTGATPTPALQKRLLELIKKETGWEKLKPEIVAVYSEAYTRDDVQALLAFYKSDAGKKLLDKEPKVARKVLALQRKTFAALMPAIEKILAEEGKSPAPATPPAAQ